MSNRKRNAVKLMAAGAMLLWAGWMSAQQQTPEEILKAMETKTSSLTSTQEAGVQKVIYVVQTGDTLWDIAKRYMNSPYYWPKIWERNTFVTNPHRIYPGDVLNLYPEGQKLQPTQFDQIDLGPAAGGGETKTIEDLQIEIEPELDKVVYKGLWAAGFLDVGDVETAGSILSNPDDKALLGTGDRVYVNVGTALGVKAGDVFSIFRITSDIQHPVPPHQLVGHRVVNLGELRIGQVKEDVAEAFIINSYREIHDKDRIVPYTPPLSMEIKITPNTVSLEGYIVTNKNDTVAMGKDEIIYIDRGEQDGVLTGNVFEVYLPGQQRVDDATGKQVTLPDQVIGKLMVLDPRPNTSVVLGTASLREFAPGEHIRMVSQ